MRIEKISANLLVYLIIGLALLVATVLIPASGAFKVPKTDNQGVTKVGKVQSVLSETTEDTPRGKQTTQQLAVKLGGQVLTIEHDAGELDANQLHFKAGDSVLVTRNDTPDGPQYFVADYARVFPLWILVGAFALFVVLVGRIQGMTSLLGMAASFLVIVRFVIPGVISGHDPVTICLIGAVIILSTSVFLAHGVNSKSSVALIGTAISLFVAVVAGAAAVGFAHLSGLAEEESATLRILTSGHINAQGLLLGAMIIGSLGVLDDVAMAQSSSVFELHEANADLSRGELYRRAMNIGRDHISATVNTLFLAYAGAALPLLMLLSLQTDSFGVLLNREFLATEIVRTVVGSFGIIASVPVTTAIAAFWAKTDLLSTGRIETWQTEP